MIPVYVPSKGRSGSSTTLRALQAEAFQSVTVIVPASEESEYQRCYGQAGWSVLPQARGGIQGARQAILEVARNRGEPFVWMLDDDTTGVFIRAGQKFIPMKFTDALADMERIARNLQAEHLIERHIAMIGPNFRQYAWSGPDFQWDVHLRNFILINPWLYNYWDHVKEDLDMVLQMLRGGYSTLRFNAYAFDSPTMGTLAGGCSDDYAAGALDEATKALVEKWPGIVSMRLNERTGYVENRVNWKAVRA